jgi:hypothetical protein
MFGPYDGILIADVPDPVGAAALSVAVGVPAPEHLKLMNVCWHSHRGWREPKKPAHGLPGPGR